MKNNACIKDRKGYVNFYYSHKKIQLWKSLGVTVKDKKKFEKQINDKFNSYNRIIIDHEKRYGEYPTVKKLKQLMNLVHNYVDDIQSLIDRFLESIKYEIRDSTLKTTASRLNYLIRYNEECERIDINEIDTDFLINFQNYLFSLDRNTISYRYINGEKIERKDKIGLSDNTTSGVLKKVKLLIGFCTENSIIKEYDIDWTRINKRITEEKFSKEALSKSEIDFLWSKRDSFKNIQDVTLGKVCVYCGSTNTVGNGIVRGDQRWLCRDCNRNYTNSYKLRTENRNLRRMAIALDMFLLQCYTSLRYSDLIRPLNQYIINDIIRLKAKKTKNDQMIPLSDRSKQILIDNNIYGNDYVSFAEHFKYVGDYNAKIKDLLYKFSDEMESFKMVRQSRSIVNNVENYIEYPRYLLINSHSGRRSCITNMINAGVSDGEGMKISGHSDLSIYRGYYDTRPLGNEQNVIQNVFG